VKNNLTLIIVGIIVLSLLRALLEFIRHRRQALKNKIFYQPAYTAAMRAAGEAALSALN